MRRRSPTSFRRAPSRRRQGQPGRWARRCSRPMCRTIAVGKLEPGRTRSILRSVQLRYQRTQICEVNRSRHRRGRDHQPHRATSRNILIRWSSRASPWRHRAGRRPGAEENAVYDRERAKLISGSYMDYTIRAPANLQSFSSVTGHALPDQSTGVKGAARPVNRRTCPVMNAATRVGDGWRQPRADARQAAQRGQAINGARARTEVTGDQR